MVFLIVYFFKTQEKLLWSPLRSGRYVASAELSSVGRRALAPAAHEETGDGQGLDQCRSDEQIRRRSR